MNSLEAIQYLSVYYHDTSGDWQEWIDSLDDPDVTVESRDLFKDYFKYHRTNLHVDNQDGLVKIEPKAGEEIESMVSNTSGSYTRATKTEAQKLVDQYMKMRSMKIEPSVQEIVAGAIEDSTGTTSPESIPDEDLLMRVVPFINCEYPWAKYMWRKSVTGENLQEHAKETDYRIPPMVPQVFMYNFDKFEANTQDPLAPIVYLGHIKGLKLAARVATGGGYLDGVKTLPEYTLEDGIRDSLQAGAINMFSLATSMPIPENPTDEQKEYMQTEEYEDTLTGETKYRYSSFYPELSPLTEYASGVLDPDSYSGFILYTARPTDTRIKVNATGSTAEGETTETVESTTNLAWRYVYPSMGGSVLSGIATLEDGTQLDLEEGKGSTWITEKSYMTRGVVLPINHSDEEYNYFEPLLKYQLSKPIKLVADSLQYNYETLPSLAYAQSVMRNVLEVDSSEGTDKLVLNDVVIGTKTSEIDSSDDTSKDLFLLDTYNHDVYINQVKMSNGFNY